MQSKSRIFQFVMVFFMTWSLTVMSGISVYNFCSVICLLASAGLICLSQTVSSLSINKPRKRNTISVSLALSFMYTSVAYEKWTESFDSILFKAGIIIITYIGLVLTIYYSVKIIYVFIEVAAKNCVTDSHSNSFFINHSFAISMLVCFAAWLPYFLYLFPGIMTPDSVNQLEQAMGMQNYSNHHPWVHTLLIKYTFRLGQLIGHSNNAGVACYTLIQMLICSAAAGFAVDTLKRFKLSKKYMLLSLSFFAFVPFNAVFAVTMWKDVIFSYAVLSLNCILLRLFLNNDNKMYIPLGLLSIIVCLFRSNGWYAFLLTALIFTIYFVIKKRTLPIVPILGVVMVVAGLVRGPLMEAFDVTQPDFVESISLPLQQVARVLVDGKYIDGEERALIDKIIDTTYVNQLYDETFADNIKELVRAGNPQYLTEHKADYMKLYIKLGLKYPGVYAKAFIGQAGGYWYPDTTHYVANVEGISSNACGVYANPLIGGRIVVKAKEIWIKLGSIVPIYGLLWCTGSIIWILIILLGYLIKDRSIDRLMIFVPTICLILTVLIATPVSGDFRYIYYLVLSLPIFLANVLLHTIIHS